MSNFTHRKTNAYEIYENENHNRGIICFRHDYSIMMLHADFEWIPSLQLWPNWSIDIQKRIVDRYDLLFPTEANHLWIAPWILASVKARGWRPCHTWWPTSQPGKQGWYSWWMIEANSKSKSIFYDSLYCNQIVLHIHMHEFHSCYSIISWIYCNQFNSTSSAYAWYIHDSQKSYWSSPQLMILFVWNTRAVVSSSTPSGSVLEPSSVTLGGGGTTNHQRHLGRCQGGNGGAGFPDFP